jgi:NADP-dependent 3-hydroxy acid dehydrogenase YdfG
MSAGMASGVPQADGSVRVEARMDVADVARAVVYMASLPLDSNVATMTVLATKMPFVGRG